MTKQCHHHFLVNQEKAEKHVFRKSKKYRTLCSVAIGTMVTAIVAWGGAVAQADEVTTPQDNIIQRTENPATNLPQAQPAPVVEQTKRLDSTGQTDGAITVTVPHDTVTQAVNQAKAEGVKTPATLISCVSKRFVSVSSAIDLISVILSSASAVLPSPMTTARSIVRINP